MIKKITILTISFFLLASLAMASARKNELNSKTLNQSDAQFAVETQDFKQQKKLVEQRKEALKRLALKRKLQKQHKNMGINPTKEYNPKKITIKDYKQINEAITEKYVAITKNDPNSIIDISPLRAKEDIKFKNGIKNKKEAIAKKASYYDEYDVKGVLLAKEKDQYVAYNFWAIKKAFHDSPGSSRTNSYDEIWASVTNRRVLKVTDLAMKYRVK